VTREAPSILVAGLINIETIARVDAFPVEYAPVSYTFFGQRTSVSGVGWNVAAALSALGDRVRLASVLGRGLFEATIRRAIAEQDVDDGYCPSLIDEQPQSVVLSEPGGRRRILLDLKDIQTVEYPHTPPLFHGVDMAVLCNIGFARGLLGPAKRAGLPIATDLHVLSAPDDEYNRDWLAVADILFCSNEAIEGQEASFARALMGRWPARVVVVGMGVRGSLLLTKECREAVRVPAVETRPIASTVGAGDALFSAFVHFVARGVDAVESLRRATVFASWKLGEGGGAAGFLDEAGLMRLAGPDPRKEE
jgi:ribokinase